MSLLKRDIIFHELFASLPQQNSQKQKDVIIGDILLQKLMTPTRTFKQEGKIHLSKLDMGMGKNYDSGWYFLFNDGLLITEKKKDEKYVFKHFVDFQQESVKVKDVESEGMH
jgi:hypothetical protein